MPTANRTTFIHLRVPKTQAPLPGWAMWADPQLDSFGGATIAVLEHTGGITYAITRCRSDERYVKKEGRNRSMSRLLAPKDDAEANEFRRTLPGKTRQDFLDMVYNYNPCGITVKELLALA
jgi:hypothetical protein